MASRQAAWIVAEVSVGALGSVLTTFVVARLIGPAEFGHAALAAAVVTLVQPVAAYAFTNAMVQRDRLEREDVATVAWAGLALACGLAAAIAAGARLLAPALPPGTPALLSALALVLPLNAVEGTANGVLLRTGNFRGLSLRGIGAQASGLSAGLGLAAAGAGAWAVVGQQLAFFGAAALLAAAFARLRPAAAFRADTLRGMAPFALSAALGGVADRTGFRAFLWVVAGGTPALAGLLQISFRLVEMARDLPAPFVHRFGLPALSRLRGDRAAFLRRLEALCLASGLLFAPAFAGLALCVPELQALALGPAWGGVPAPVRVLAAAAAPTCFHLPLPMAFTASGWPAVNLSLTCVAIATNLALALLVPAGSAVAAAAAWGAALLFVAALASAVAARGLGFRPARQLVGLARALLPAAAVTAAVLGLEASGALPGTPLGALAAKAAAGLAAGLPLAVLVGRPAWRELSGRG